MKYHVLRRELVEVIEPGDCGWWLCQIPSGERRFVCGFWLRGEA